MGNQSVQCVATSGEEVMLRIDAAGMDLLGELQALAAVVESGVSAGMARALKSKELIHRAHEFPGRLRGLLADVAVIHQALSKICIQNECELRIPTHVGGVQLPESITGVSVDASSSDTETVTVEATTASLVTVAGGGDR